MSATLILAVLAVMAWAVVGRPAFAHSHSGLPHDAPMAQEAACAGGSPTSAAAAEPSAACAGQWHGSMPSCCVDGAGMACCGAVVATAPACASAQGSGSLPGPGGMRRPAAHAEPPALAPPRPSPV